MKKLFQKKIAPSDTSDAIPHISSLHGSPPDEPALLNKQLREELRDVEKSMRSTIEFANEDPIGGVAYLTDRGVAPGSAKVWIGLCSDDPARLDACTSHL